MVKDRRLFVDADACPVKNEIREMAIKYDISPFFIASYAHFGPNRGPEWIFVDPDREAADIYIVNHVRKGDVVVTQDMGLASLLTGKEVYVLTANGKLLNEEDMPHILHRRYLSYKELSAGHRIRGPKAFSSTDRRNFCLTLEELLSQLQGKS
ncbi:hypothetical protein EV207_101334 [Scopulibacillus darangshiensis]|uniref:UPF0178 protein EV207_101334 n=1 Tax=Scopulibacillus darangshiensis TaxID=442528 RepID=A0A4R2PEJ3_9BACL|nr:DUF188 domain-containing protein [Scopulibacillus darangshiensis]TCP32355.1 hypothetical protein EV207_101334 [Scopulibacillus darangshiensis]